ncbi:MAG: hypothetical protein PHY95_04855 [Candidatus ainarchaeum sp.]|nr:hypothetical protein [Candidatus ainarchaeum sp.]
MKHILAVLLVAILLFGCAQQGEATQAGTGGTTGSTPETGASGTTGTGATGETATGAEAETGTTGDSTEVAATGETGTGTETGATGVTMDTWSMETLAAMGVPMHCTVTYSGEMTGTFDIYVLGQKSAMSGTFATAAGDQEMSYVFKDNKIYMPASLFAGMPGFEGCVWVTRSAEATASTETTVSTETVPATFECVPGVFGDEKFATEGTECDFNTAMASVCDSVPAGEARDQCLSSLGIE